VGQQRPPQQVWGRRGCAVSAEPAATEREALGQCTEHLKHATRFEKFTARQCPQRQSGANRQPPRPRGLPLDDEKLTVAARSPTTSSALCTPLAGAPLERG